jgi:hypothetical protein
LPPTGPRIGSRRRLTRMPPCTRASPSRRQLLPTGRGVKRMREPPFRG